MTKAQLDWFLDSHWHAGVAYGRLVPGKATSLPEDKLLQIKEEAEARIRAGLLAERRAEG